MNDPILDEIRKYRDAHAASFNYDLDAMYEDLKRRELESGRTFVLVSNKDVEPSRSNVARGHSDFNNDQTREGLVSMKPPKCKAFPSSERYRNVTMRSLHFDMETLVIEMQGEGFEFARVLFHAPDGFRVLDERDLCEFWDNYHSKNGWLYVVEEGGWLELEQHRQLFNSHVVRREIKEYLIVCDQCVSVFSVKPPEIIDIGAEPKWPGP